MDILILARNYIQYVQYCTESRKTPTDFKYIHDCSSVRGLDNFMVIKIGEYYKRDDIDMVYEVLHSRRGVVYVIGEF